MAVRKPAAAANVSRRRSVPGSATPLLVANLGCTREQTVQVRASLQVFDADWSAPGMEEYDKL